MMEWMGTGNASMTKIFSQSLYIFTAGVYEKLTLKG